MSDNTKRRPSHRLYLLAGLVLLLGALGSWLGYDWWATLPVDLEPSYVGRSRCIECHQKQGDLWHGSHHDLAMDMATDQTVLGNFDNAELEHFDITSRMFRDADKFMVNTEGPDGELQDFEVQYVLGVEPLQQYMVELQPTAGLAEGEIGQLQVLRITWDTEAERWYFQNPPDVHEKLRPGDDLHWTGIASRWNNSCADCHSTNLQKGYDDQKGVYHTTFSEIDVSCESCHGPGSTHVKLAESGSVFWDRHHGYGLARLKGKDPGNEIQSCAPCHSHRRVVHPGFVPGESYHDHFSNAILAPSLYHDDGQIMEEVYVFGSFLQSKMYAAGVTCSDCHDPHGLEVRGAGNATCAGCHLPAKFDIPDHHFHEAGSPGSRCVECHMPAVDYMVVDPRRDHSIRVPRPDLSVKLGTPNACNRCHDDKDAKWAADWVTKWHGPERARDVRHAETFAAARKGDPGVEKRLLAVVGDTESPAFTRASALLALRPYRDSRGFFAAIRALKDSEALVRVAAISKLENWPRDELRRLLTPLLHDSARAVRTETVRVLSPINKGDLNIKDNKAYVRAYGELQKRFTDHLDRPEAHLSLGIQASNRGDLVEAKKRYRQSIRRDENFVPARVNLADLVHREGDKAQAERLWREVTKLMPEWGDGFYSLGLLVAEDPARLKEAAAILETAAKKMPEHPRVHYNLGISLWKLGEKARGAQSIIQAGKIDPANPEYPFGLAQFYVEDKNWRAALPHAQRAAELAPTDPEVNRLLSQINSKL